MRMIVAVVSFVLIAAFAPSTASAQERGDTLVVEVKNSIERGVDYLRRTQRSWESVSYPGGPTSLAVLALLNCGVKADDRAVAAGLEYLRGLKPKKTYVRALQTMVFAEARKTEDKERIQQNVDWLLEIRDLDSNGKLHGWRYGKGVDAGPPRPDNSNTQYALLGLWAGKQAGATIDGKIWAEIRDFYQRTQLQDEVQKGSWPYVEASAGRSVGSFTMTTAGLCGLLIAGAELNERREVLRPDGTADHCGEYKENPAIASALGYIGRNLRYQDGHATYYNLYGIERAGRLTGLRFFGSHDWYREGSRFLVGDQRADGSWGLSASRGQLYQSAPVDTSFALLFLSKGRTPVLITKLVHSEPGVPRENDTDWNNDRNDLRNLTQFASKELFLGLPLAWQSLDMLHAVVSSEADRKIVVAESGREINGAGIRMMGGRATAVDANGNKINAKIIRVKMLSPSEFHDRLTAKLAFLNSTARRLETLRQDAAGNDKEIKKLEAAIGPDLADILADMLASPIMYFNGHKSPLNRFQPIERELLRKYVDNGGFLFVEACCGREEFDNGFKALAAKLWPGDATRLQELDSNHAVWTSRFPIKPNDPYRLMGIQLGCKTAVIYSPQDVSCLWESNDPSTARGDRAFKLGANIIAYATGLEAPRPRLTRVEVSSGRDQANLPRGYLKVAQIKYSGDWQPAPNAMHNLMDHLRAVAGLDVVLRTEALDVDSRNLIDFKFIYMHGRRDFEFEAAKLKQLRFNLENGGLLFADACCGKEAFDKSFRKFAEQLFPDRKLQDVPADDPLFGKELNGVRLDDQTIKCRLQRSGPMRGAAPMLEGIKIDNRWVLLYSKYDIGCALERHRSSDCLGYDPDSALKIAGAAVLYLLKP